jgi:hypothetical protein
MRFLSALLSIPLFLACARAAEQTGTLPARGKYLLLDARVVEKVEGAKLRVGKVAKHPANPLFGEEHPWEHRFDNLYANVMLDEKEGLYRCWYSPFIYYTPSAKAKWKAPPPPPGQPSHLMGVCYAVSKDGLRWEKPMMDIAPFQGQKTNLVVIGPHGAGILLDPRDPDPARRYKMICLMEKDFPGVAFSPDGMHWSDRIACPDMKARADTHNNAFWAPEIGKYVGITRLFLGQRVVGRTESADFIHWTAATPVLTGTPEAQTYAMPVFRHAGVYLGLLMVFRTEEDRVHCELAWSADSTRWDRIDPGTPLIPDAEEKGAYDWGCVYGALSPIFLEDEIRLYYGASDDTHYGKRKGHLALAVLRPDGFAGWEPEAKGSPGVVVTRPVKVSGELRVTADARGGSMAVKAIDEAGKPLAESEPIEVDATDRPVRWKEGASALRGKPVRLRFELQDAKVYSFRFAGT